MATIFDDLDRVHSTTAFDDPDSVRDEGEVSEGDRRPEYGTIVDEIPTHRTWRKPSGGLFVFGACRMTIEPSSKRAIAFFDGQNLYHAARRAFGYSYPNYDPIALAAAVSVAQRRELAEVRFYTGIPDRQDDPFWHYFWANKLSHLGRRGATV